MPPRTARGRAPPPPEYDAFLFPDKKHSDRYALFQTQPIDVGRNYDSNVLNFFRIPQMAGVDRNNMLNTLLFPAEVNEEAVRMFYCNLTDYLEDDGSLGFGMEKGVSGTEFVRQKLYTYLYGNRIEITQSDINSLIDVDNYGLWMRSTFDGASYYEELFNVAEMGDNWREPRNLYSSRLSLKRWVLHQFITDNYVPRKGQQTQVTQQDLWLLVHILRGDRILYFDLIYRCFKNVTNKHAQAVLRGSRLITLLLRRKGVQFRTPTTQVHVPNFSFNTISQGSWKKVDDHWVRKRPLEPLVGGGALLPGSGADTDDEGHAPPSHASSSSTSELAQLRTDMNTGLSNLNTSITNLQDDFRTFRSDVQGFMDHFYRIYPRPPSADDPPS